MERERERELRVGVVGRRQLYTEREVGRVEKGALHRGLMWTESPCDPEQRLWPERGAGQAGEVEAVKREEKWGGKEQR